MYYTIYKTINKINNKIYIGKHQTKNLNDNYLGSGKHLTYSIKKYGKENFVKEILFIFDNELEMNSKEAELVTEEFCQREDTYNICSGGKGGFSYINANGLSGRTSFTTETALIVGRKGLEKIKTLRKQDHNWVKQRRQNLSKAQKESYKNGRIGGFSGKIHSDIAKIKMSQSHNNKGLGVKNSQYNTCWITNNIHSIKIKKENLEMYLNLGYKKGRIIKNIFL